MSLTFPAHFRMRPRCLSKRRSLRLEFICKASSVASKRRIRVRRSWISSGLGRLGAFFRSFRNLRTFFLIEPISSIMRHHETVARYLLHGKLAHKVRVNRRRRPLVLRQDYVSGTLTNLLTDARRSPPFFSGTPKARQSI